MPHQHITKDVLRETERGHDWFSFGATEEMRTVIWKSSRRMVYSAGHNTSLSLMHDVGLNHLYLKHL